MMNNKALKIYIGGQIINIQLLLLLVWVEIENLKKMQLPWRQVTHLILKVCGILESTPTANIKIYQKNYLKNKKRK